MARWDHRRTELLAAHDGDGLPRAVLELRLLWQSISSISTASTFTP